MILKHLKTNIRITKKLNLLFILKICICDLLVEKIAVHSSLHHTIGYMKIFNYLIKNLFVLWFTIIHNNYHICITH